jgi:hypothetical protein
MQPRALGHRVSDEFIVPVCRIHHRELHRQGDEAAWWDKAHIDPLQSRSGCGSTRGLTARKPSQAKTSGHGGLQRRWTCQLKVHSMQTSIRIPMQRAPFLKRTSRTQPGDLIGAARILIHTCLE